MIETFRSLAEDHRSVYADMWRSTDAQARNWTPQSLGDLDRWMDITQFQGSPEVAMSVSAHWACVQAVSGDLAKIPLRTCRRTSDDEREIARNHYLYRLLRWRANPEMSAFRFKRLMQSWILQHGNAFAEIEISGRGQVVALWPWHPSKVSVERPVAGGPLVYTYRLGSGEPIRRPGELILHLRGLESDGLMGLSVLEAHRQRFNYSHALESHGYEFFKNGARPLGVLEHPGELGEEGIEASRAMWESAHGGITRAHRVAVLEEGMKYHEVGVRAVDAQYIESMKFGIEDIARIHGVPPHRIGHLEEATNNNIEHQGKEYVQFCVGVHGENWTQEIQQSLLSTREQETIYTEFDYEELLRGDYAAQAAFFGALLDRGTLTNDEVRGKFNLNRHKDGMGAKPRVALNTKFIDEKTPEPQAAPDPKDKPPSEPKRYVNGEARHDLAA